MAELPTVDEVNRFLAEAFPAASADGVRCEALERGRAVARLRHDPTRLRPGAYVPGPALFGLADSALWFASFTVFGVEAMAVTSEMSIRFLRPAVGGDVLAEATVESTSRRSVAGTIRLWVDGAPDRLVALAQGTYARPR